MTLAEVSIRCADRWDRGECRVAIRVVRNSRGLRIVIHREHPTRKVYQTRVEDWPALKDLWRLGASLENQWRSPLLCPRADYQGHSVGINESNTLRMGRAFLVISADPIRVVCTFMGPWNGSSAEVQAFSVDRSAMAEVVEAYRAFLAVLDPVLRQMVESDRYEDS